MPTSPQPDTSARNLASRQWPRPLRRQVFLAAVLLVLPLLAAAFWAGSLNYRERVADLEDQTTSMSTIVVAYLDRYLAAYDGLARALGRHSDIQAMDGTRAAPILAEVLRERPGIMDAVLVNRAGEFVASGAPGRGAQRPEWAQAVLTSDRPAIGELTRHPTTGEYAVVLGYPILDGSGSLIGALGLPLRLDGFERAFASIPLPDGSLVTVTDTRGRVIARSVDGRRYAGQQVDPHPQPPNRVPRRVQWKGLDGVERVFSNAVLARGPWLVSVGIPVRVAAAKAQALWLRSLGILVAGLVGYLALTSILSKRLLGGVAHLEAVAHRIAAGDLDPPERRPMPTSELAQLQDAFATMVRKLKEARESLDAQMAEERRIREELQALQRQVIRQERLAAVGLLVSGVAHELNNPLQAIMGFAELLNMQKQLPPQVLDDLALIQKESARACSIIRNLSKFSRQQPAQAGPVNLTDVIASVTELRQRRLQQDQIDLVVDTQRVRPTIAVFTELQQVVLNFVVNAEQSLLAHDSGRPKRMIIRTREVDDHVLLEVEDTGPGVKGEDEPKLFQPFFTTKPVGQGTGLGLSVSYGIIDSLGGTMGYRSAAGGGAVFYFELPAEPA